MGNTPGGLPYQLGEPVSSYTDIQGWSLHAGTSKADKSPVCIFKYNPKSTNLNGNTTASAQNALKLAKTMKHPNVVRCLDGIETPAGEILIITEPVVPLLDWLTTTRAVETNQDTFANAVTLGLAGVVRALSFLNNDVSICHGLFSHHAVFVNTESSASCMVFGAGHLPCPLHNDVPVLPVHPATDLWSLRFTVSQ